MNAHFNIFYNKITNENSLSVAITHKPGSIQNTEKNLGINQKGCTIIWKVALKRQLSNPTMYEKAKPLETSNMQNTWTCHTLIKWNLLRKNTLKFTFRKVWCQWRLEVKGTKPSSWHPHNSIISLLQILCNYIQAFK